MVRIRCVAVAAALVAISVTAGAQEGEWWAVEADDTFAPLYYVTDVWHAYSDEDGVE